MQSTIYTDLTQLLSRELTQPWSDIRVIGNRGGLHMSIYKLPHIHWYHFYTLVQ